MGYYVLKISITTILIVIISEISKRSTLAGAILASIPLISVLAMLWLYIETKDAAKISSLATNIFWLVLPSLALFVSLPLLLKKGVHFYLSLSVSIVITVVCYFLMLHILKNFGIKL